MPKKELIKLVVLTLIVNVALMIFSTVAFSNSLAQYSSYLILVFVCLLLYLKRFVRKYHINENYRNLLTYRKMIISILTVIILILIGDTIFYLVPQAINYFEKEYNNKRIDLNGELIDSIFKILTSSVFISFPTYLVSKINSFKKADALTVQLFNTATYFHNTDVVIPNNTKEFSLSLHNFSKNAVNAFFLGICEENDVKKILDERNWNNNFIIGKLPKSPKSFEKIEPNKDSKLRIIKVEQLKDELQRRLLFHAEEGYKLCAVYYIQEEKNANWVTIKKHFILEYNAKEKNTKVRFEKYLHQLQCHRLAVQYRKYAAINPDKNYKRWLFREADRLDPLILNFKQNK